MQLALKTCPETLQLLRELGIIYHVEETIAAVQHYNQLIERSIGVYAPKDDRK